jgi:hypothetical protein
MKNRKFVIVLSFVVSSFLIPFCDLSAQELAEGVWEGIRTVPSNSLSPVAVSMRVENAGGSQPSIVILHVLGSRRATDVEFEGGELRYSFKVPGRDVVSECALRLQDDGRFSGPCSGDNGAEFMYTYHPPRR